MKSCPYSDSDKPKYGQPNDCVRDFDARLIGLPARTASTAAATTAAAISRPAVAAIPASATTSRLRPGFIHIHRAAMQLGPVQVRDCRLRSLRIAHLDESEAAWLPRVTVRDQIDALYGAIGFKRRLKVRLGRLITQISYKYVGHNIILLLRKLSL